MSWASRFCIGEHSNGIHKLTHLLFLRLGLLRVKRTRCCWAVEMLDEHSIFTITQMGKVVIPVRRTPYTGSEWVDECKTEIRDETNLWVASHVWCNMRRPKCFVPLSVVKHRKATTKICASAANQCPLLANTCR